MRLEWNAAQTELRERFRAFAAGEVAPGAVRRDSESAFDRELWRRLADAGLWRLRGSGDGIDEGHDLWNFLAAFEGLASGAVDMGFVLSAIAHAGLLQLLLQNGTSHQLRRTLSILTDGGVGATAATERGGGSHVSGIRTSAERRGDHLVLSGRKEHITNAPVADVLLIVGRIPALAPRDISLFLVDAHSPGVTLGEAEDLMGQRSSPTGPIVLDSVRVGEEDVVGGPGNGLATLYSLLAFDRLMYGVAVAAFLSSLLAKGLDRACEREAFGVPLAEHEYVQDKLVDMKFTIESARWLSYAAVAALLAHDHPAASSRASLAKLVAAEGMVRAGLELIQIFGHAGYERRSGIERVLRDSIALRLAGGTSEMQKKNVFKELLAERRAATEPVVDGRSASIPSGAADGPSRISR